MTMTTSGIWFMITGIRLIIVGFLDNVADYVDPSELESDMCPPI